MDIRIKFLGAAQTVTGSKYILDIDDFRLMLDCGLFQGLKPLRLRNWDEFPIEPGSIDAVILSHAHLDHSGYLPRLFKQGYDGPVYCTSATADLVEILLKDAAKLQVEEAMYAAKKGYSVHKNPKPLYDAKDVELVLPKILSFFYEEEISLTDRISVNFRNASHILGAAIVELKIKGDNQEKRIVFSGDLGRDDDPLLYPPQHMTQADILLVESTYGTKNNPSNDPAGHLGEVINITFERGGCVVIPAFSVGRTQTMLYYVHDLMTRGAIPKCPVYMDSPMAISATGIYKKHFEFHKLTEEQLEMDESFINGSYLHYIHDQEKSVGLNKIDKGAIIISASGMLNGGRIMHHLYNRLPRPNDTLLLVGYQAEGTRGRRITDGEIEVRIFGEMVPVRCFVEELDGLSGHADRKELYHWLEGFERSPKMTFFVHGEYESSKHFAENVHEKYGWNTYVPDYLESVELFKGI